MSSLIFNGSSHDLTFYKSDGTQISGPWYANNIVDSKVKMRFLPDGVYQFLDTSKPHRHGNADDTVNGAYGTYGIFRLKPFTHNGVSHAGVGVHSGRHSKGGADHPTHGCIRTTDDVMQAICYYIVGDALETLTVMMNYDQRKKHPHYQGDPHRYDSIRIA
ncbi:hypothetical protein [Schlesneria paludicola]|uniref:hypothetical protein n=1 Tax=Schlesneria paludicola TaxID=360056 RepID=UPI00029AA4AF|nr:hypothetical protein [Schlesneria paludicola]